MKISQIYRLLRYMAIITHISNGAEEIEGNSSRCCVQFATHEAKSIVEGLSASFWIT